MKKNFLLSAILLLAAFLFFTACSKRINGDIFYSRLPVPSGLVDSAKTWYAHHIDNNAPTIKRYGPMKAFWDSCWIISATDGNMLLIVPAPEHQVSNETFTIRRFFTFWISGHNIKSGRIIELVGKNYNVERNLDFLLKNYNQDKIEGFNGGILQYDLSYNPILQATYENGAKNIHKHSSFVHMNAHQVNSLPNSGN